ncbi:hypothetical protein [Winogradskyella wichelsiae]|uniref:hypothetical protein n=1 Tax=Winogradskyella wichelsiae TaxID=2697007 RepID=UPI001C54655A|nr:hypothetical protein [Winogradskyella wichelsiae]
MKYLISFFIAPLFILSAVSQKETFIGKWTAEDHNEIGYLLFDSEGYAAFEISGQIMGGKEFYINDQKGKMTYAINYETTPIEIDFTLTKIESGESKKLLGIAEFTDKNTVNFNINFDNVRPSQFDKNSITLKRVK